MKQILAFTLGFLAFTSYSSAQLLERIDVKGGELPYFYEKYEYKYPAFIKAKVYFNDGDSAGGKLNYNYLSQSMKLLDKKDTLALVNESNVKYITMGLDTFFYDNGYYEWVATSATARLAVKHKLKLSQRIKLNSSFGTGSPTDRVQTQEQYEDYNKYPLTPNEQYIFFKENTYYISQIDKNGENHFIPATKKNIEKLFASKKVEDYIKTNGLNLNKEQDLIDVFVYISRPK